MANPREKQRSRPEPNPRGGEAPEELGGRLNALPELMRRALSIGFSGFFMTEEAVRRALGDTLPKDWVDFAVEQSERTRSEFLDRLSFEIGQALGRVELAGVLSELLRGRTLEVKAQIRLRDDEGRSGEGGKPRFEVESAELGDDE